MNFSYRFVRNTVIVQKPFRFHQLKNKKGKDLEDFFAIDVKTIRDPWRLILRPLDHDKRPFEPCHINEVADIVEIVEIREVKETHDLVFYLNQLGEGKNKHFSIIPKWCTIR